MRPIQALFFALLSSHFVLSSHRPAKRSYSTHDYYVLEHDSNAGASLTEIAQSLGVEVVEQVGALKDFWLLRAEKVDGDELSKRDAKDRVLNRLDDLRAQAASTHDVYLTQRSTDNYQARSIVSSIRYFSRQVLRQRVKRAPPPPVEESESPSKAVAEHFNITDPLFHQQWHIVNEDYPEHTMNVTGVWEMGITGKGVISALIDDGLDYEHRDLAANFYAHGSHDFNDHTELPTPQSFDDHHGTRCAGQIAAVRNDVCGIGLAYNSQIAGIRILSGPVTDTDEAAALNFDYQNTSLYSCSWGPRDNGQSMEGPNYVIEKAVVEGINNGRGGKGSIFVFASGNGAPHGDQCNFDGYTNSIYSVTVSAIDYKGLHPRYSEPCAANLIVAYSSGSGKHIVTTDVGEGQCSSHHSGTSAAAPNAAGVFVLALEARPDLTWRDIQHLCVVTARVINPEDPDWEMTDSGRPYSYKYGYGAIDAYEYVKAAIDWTLTKPQTWFETETIQIGEGTMDSTGEMQGGELIPPGGLRSSVIITKETLEANNFESLEHINVRVYIAHSRRGDVEVELVSPNGIKSVLAAVRRNDAVDTGFPGWVFMTVKHWGEDPIGEWTIHVSDQAKENEEGHFLGWSMTLWGSSIDPDPAKIKKFVVPLTDPVLPPHQEPPPETITPTPSATTRQHSKPTDYLSDHGSAPGEKHKPAFPTKGSQPTSSSLPSSTPTPDEGWFSDMTRLVSDQKWLIGAAGAVVVFAAGAGIFFWRRRRARRARSGEYTTIPAGDDLPMSNIRGPRTRELYDAFGEVSDDDDADEETGLRSGRPVVRDQSPSRLGFHSAFLEDDDHDPATATPHIPRYEDEPEIEDSKQPPAATEQPQRSDARATSPTSGSGDDSWEHAQ